MLLVDRNVEDEQDDEASKRAAKLKGLRDDWERSTNRKLQANAIRRQVQGILAENEMALEARRARLITTCGVRFVYVLCPDIKKLSYHRRTT